MSDQDANRHTGLEIGRTLRLTREKRRLSLQQVEEATKIRTRYLRDLENENFDVLPAVYMLGSLKTYAEHLGLDGAAMTGELKRCQSSLQPEQDQAQEDPPSPEPRGLLASLSHLVGIGGTIEDEAGTKAPVRRPGLYVSLAVVLVFVLATYLASSIRSEDQPSISLVQEPTVSQLPSEIALIGNVADNERNTEDVNSDGQPEKQAESPAIDDKVKAEQSEQEKYAPREAQAPSSSATAFASASSSASASASSASAGSVLAPATATPARTRIRPEPAAREQPSRGDMAVPTGTSVRVSGSQSPQEGPVDATRFGNGVSNTVEKAMNSVW